MWWNIFNTKLSVAVVAIIAWRRRLIVDIEIKSTIS